jgi:hypothetical protein
MRQGGAAAPPIAGGKLLLPLPSSSVLSSPGVERAASGRPHVFWNAISEEGCEYETRA